MRQYSYFRTKIVTIAGDDSGRFGWHHLLGFVALLKPNLTPLVLPSLVSDGGESIVWNFSHRELSTQIRSFSLGLRLHIGIIFVSCVVIYMLVEFHNHRRWLIGGAWRRIVQPIWMMYFGLLAYILRYDCSFVRISILIRLCCIEGQVKPSIRRNLLGVRLRQKSVSGRLFKINYAYNLSFRNVRIYEFIILSMFSLLSYIALLESS